MRPSPFLDTPVMSIHCLWSKILPVPRFVRRGHNDLTWLLSVQRRVWNESRRFAHMVDPSLKAAMAGSLALSPDDF